MHSLFHLSFDVQQVPLYRWLRQRLRPPWPRILMAGAMMSGVTACHDVTSAHPVTPDEPDANRLAVSESDSGSVQLSYVCGNTFRVRYTGTDTATIHWKVHGTRERGTLLLQGRGIEPFHDTTFTTQATGPIRWWEHRHLRYGVPNARTSCIARPRLAVILERGVTERHGLRDTSYKTGTVVPYDFRSTRGFDNVLVTLDGTYVPAVGKVTMDSDHVLIASADSVVSLTPIEQRVSNAIRQVVRGPDPVTAYRTLLAQLAPLASRPDLNDLVQRAEYLAYDPIVDSTNIRRADAALATHLFSLTPQLSATPSRATPHAQTHTQAPPHPAVNSARSLDVMTDAPRDTLEPTTVLYVNGIFNTPGSSATTAVHLEQVMHQLPRFTTKAFTFAHFYNRNLSHQAESETERQASCAASLHQRMPFLGSRSWGPYLQRCLGKHMTQLFTDNDVVEALTQYAQIFLHLAPSAPDVDMLADVLQQTRTSGQHILLVPHSQGTLMAQQAMQVMRDTYKYGENLDSIGIAVVPLAAPTSTGWPFPPARLKPITIFGDIVPTLGGNQWPRLTTPKGEALTAQLESISQRMPNNLIVKAYVAVRRIKAGIDLHSVNSSYLSPPAASAVRDSVASAYREVAAGELSFGIAVDQLIEGHGRSLPLYLTVYNQNDLGRHTTVPLKGRDIAWRSTSPTLASVDGNGRVEGLHAGTTTVWARSWSDSASVAYTIQPTPTLLNGTYTGSWETLDYNQPFIHDIAFMTLAVSGPTVSGSVGWNSSGHTFSSQIFQGTVDPTGTTATLTLLAPDPEAVSLGKRCIGDPGPAPQDGDVNVGGGSTDCYQVITVHLSGTSLMGTSHGIGPVLNRSWSLQKLN